jgi:benzoate 4-monooxygenase
MNGRLTELQKQSFIPFSVGPRACIGRNVAEMEMTVIVSAVFKGWEFVARPGAMEEWKTREGFLRKPLGLMVGMKKRGA